MSPKTIAEKVTLGSLNVANVRRLVVTRTKGAVRTIKESENIAKFLKEHAADELMDYDQGRLSSVGPGVDYRSLIVNLK